MLYLSICFISFVFLLFSGFVCFALGVYFVQSDLVYFVEWNIITLNSSRVVMTLLFDWISLSFMGFVLLISSLVILYRDDYIHGDYNINRFVLLVLIFVLSIIFLIIRPNIIRILLG
jgi:NADH-ubiquinone oxidoreductase chain 5